MMKMIEEDYDDDDDDDHHHAAAAADDDDDDDDDDHHHAAAAADDDDDDDDHDDDDDDDHEEEGKEKEEDDDEHPTCKTHTKNIQNSNVAISHPFHNKGTWQAVDKPGWWFENHFPFQPPIEDSSNVFMFVLQIASARTPPFMMGWYQWPVRFTIEPLEHGLQVSH